MAAKTGRIEMRADPDDEALIQEAAKLRRQSVSAFVLQAAAEEAGRVVARADNTVMPAEQFDRLISSLDEPDPAPRLAEAARRPRRFTRE